MKETDARLQTNLRIDRLQLAKNLDPVQSASPSPNLLAVQFNSFGNFLSFINEELEREIKSRFPALEFEKIYLSDKPNHSPEFCIQKRMSYIANVRIKTHDRDRKLFSIPMMTERASFIINGVEKIFLSQLIDRPGITFYWKENETDTASLDRVRIIPEKGKGPQLRFEVKDGSLELSYSKNGSVPAATFFCALGILLDAKRLSGTPLGRSIDKNGEDSLSKKRLEKLFKLTGRKDCPQNPIDIQKRVQDFFLKSKEFDLGKQGRASLDRALRPDNKTEVTTSLTADDLNRLVICLSHPNEWPATEIFDSPDHLSHKSVRRCGHFFKEAVLHALDEVEKLIGDKKSKHARKKEELNNDTNEVETFSYLDELLNHAGKMTRSIEREIKGNRLLQVLDQENPLSEITQKRRLSVFGPEGATSDRVRESLRIVDRSHRGRICPIETTSGGQNVGLVTSLALSAEIDKETGELKAPFRRIHGNSEDDISWLTPWEEADALADSDRVVPSLEDLEKGVCSGEVKLERLRLQRYGISSIESLGSKDLTGVCGERIFSVSGSLIPFIEHDDAHRALMGANMQRQAIPLLYPEAPYVGTGLERRVANESNVFPRAKADGTVTYADATTVEVLYDEKSSSVDEISGEVPFSLPGFERTRKGKGKRLRPIVRTGDRIKEGQTLVDGYATERGDLALGANLLAAYMCWKGYNFEDGIVLSQRVLDEDLLTSIHIHECTVELRDTVYQTTDDKGNEMPVRERIQKGIRGRFGRAGRHLGRDGIVRIGSEVHPGDVLVSKVSMGPIGTRDPSDIFDDFANRGHKLREEEVANLIKGNGEILRPLRVPDGINGTVIGVRRDTEGLDYGVNEIITVQIAQTRKVEVGDKLAGRHGNKGVISKILPTSEMPFLADGTPVDIIMNPLGILSRLNVGQLYECALGWAAKHGGIYDTKTNNFTQYVACPAFESPSSSDIDAYLEQANNFIKHECKRDLEMGTQGFAPIIENGKTILYDGKTGEAFPAPVAVGYAYMLKLDHMVQDKMHARSTGPYSLIDQQPIKGRANGGGQRIGDMETWALEAYGASNLLKELMTDHSDSLAGRRKLEIRALEHAFGTEPKENDDDTAITNRLPETTEEFLMYLRALCLDPIYSAASQNESDDDVFKLGYDYNTELKGINVATIKCGDAENTSKIGQRWSESEEVKTSSLFNFKKKEVSIKEGGLLDPTIFGTNAIERRSRMGFIRLNVDEKHIITHPWFRQKDGKKKRINLLPVLPLDLRPVKLLSNGTFISHDLNFLYRKVLICNDNIKHLRDLKSELEERFKISNSLEFDALFDTSTNIKSDEKGLADGAESKKKSLVDDVKRDKKGLVDRALEALQNAVDQLIDNASAEVKATDNKNRQYVSLTKRISGKSGLLRNRLLGKRVDFSGRSVIVPDPKLSFDECGIPFEMAYELFKPQLLDELLAYEAANTNSSENLHSIDDVEAKLRETLSRISKRFIVLLNRQPTLHRMGIQAYRPVFVRGKAIRLHPLSCPAFNADFDGDTMAVLVPLEEQSIEEARKRMLSPLNILSPADGQPLATPSQDMVIGLYSMATDEKDREVLTKSIWRNCQDQNDIESGRSKREDKTNKLVKTKRMVRSVHRPSLPDRITKKSLADFTYNICCACIEAGHSIADVARVLSNMMSKGFECSTKSGLTLSYSDLLYNKLDKRKGIFRRIREAIDIEMKFGHLIEERLRANYLDGLLAESELYNELVKLWDKQGVGGSIDSLLRTLPMPSFESGQSSWGILRKQEFREHLLKTLSYASEDLIDELISHLDWDDIERTPESTKDFIIQDPVLAIADSGARGSSIQIRQIIAFRGYMSGSYGEAIDIPVTHGLAEGMSPGEYWLSTYGSRRKVIDSALGTEKTGELARELVNAMQDVVITQENCNTTQGITIQVPEKDSIEEENLIGRYLAAPVLSRNEETTVVELAQADECIKSLDLLDAFRRNGVSTITLKSPLTCQAKDGVCAHCYGWDLSKRHDISLGSAIGIIAAQSLSERTTQMNLSSFHGGGVANDKAIAQGLPELMKALHPSEKDESQKDGPVDRKMKRLQRRFEEGADYIGIATEVVNVLREVLGANDIRIDNKHLEVIAREMVRDGKSIKSTKYLSSHPKSKSILGAAAVTNPRTVFAEAILAAEDAGDDAAVDHLRGVKENLILGRTVPVGSKFENHDDIEQEKSDENGGELHA